MNQFSQGIIAHRILATTLTVLLVWLLTRDLQTSLLVGALEIILQTMLRFFFDRNQTRATPTPTPEPMVLWFTGLSGAGKTTIARRVYDAMKEKGLTVEWLDGDVTREFLPQTGFSKAERDAHVLKSGFIAKLLEQNGVFVVASYISPYAETRARVRELCRNYVEVHVATPLEECERRDVKGLYARARKGEISNFTGLDDPYEEPQNPEIRIQTQEMTPDEARDKVLEWMGLSGQSQRSEKPLSALNQ